MVAAGRTRTEILSFVRRFQYDPGYAFPLSTPLRLVNNQIHHIAQRQRQGLRRHFERAPELVVGQGAHDKTILS
jgi:hypothetical protein